MIAWQVWAPCAHADPSDIAARRDAAEDRIASAAAWTGGEMGWQDAFPEIEDLSFGDPDAVRVRLATLSVRGVDRAGERAAPAPTELTPEEVAAWRAAVSDATDAEDRADAAEARFLSGLLAGLQRAPGLTDASVARWEATLPRAPADPNEPIPADVLAAGDDVRALRAWRRAAWRTMTRPGDPELANVVAAALVARPIPDQADGIARARIEAMRDRVLRVAPLLDQPLASNVSAWLVEADRLLGPVAIDEGSAAPVAAVEAPPPGIAAPVAEPRPPDPARDAAAVARIASWKVELDRLRGEHEEAALRTSLDPQRQPQRDATFLGLRGLVGEIHAGVTQPWVRERVAPGEPAAVDAFYEAIGLLIDAKQLRREARTLATDSAREDARRSFIPEVLEEAEEIPLVWDYNVQRFGRRVRSVPALLMDLTAVYTFAARSALFFSVLAAWWFLRSAVPRWLATAIESLANAEAQRPWGKRVADAITPWLENPNDVIRLAPLVGRLGRRLIDLLGACALLWWTRAETPVIHLLVTLLVALAVWRVRPLLVDLAFATVEDRRPALVITDEVRRSRFRMLVAWFVGWWLVTACIGVLLLDVLAADKWRQLADAAAWRIGLALAVLALWIEAPDIRASLTQLQPTALVRRMTSPGNVWTRLPRAAVGLLLLVLFHVGRLTAEIVATSRRLRWVGTVLARRQLAPSTELRPLDPDMAARIARLDHGLAPKLHAAVARVVEAHDRWKTARSGMVALTAERGAGLALVPAVLSAALEGVRLVQVPHRISDEQSVRVWLAETLGVPDDNEGFVAALQLQAPCSFVVSDAHLLFLRRAGGFSALRWMLGIMQATSEEHFWVWCTDAQTWAYLKDAPGAVDLGVFQDQVRVEPMLPDELGGWLLDPLSRDGLHASFLGLARGGADRVDPRAEMRARRAYLHVLDDLSQGRPLIARSLWRASLRSGENGAIEHAVPALPQAVGVDALPDEDLFVLTALVVHAGLDLDSLSEVLNRPPNRVQSACRRLEARGVLIGDEQGTWFDVPEIVHPSVVRVLKQRAFLDVR